MDKICEQREVLRKVENTKKMIVAIRKRERVHKREKRRFRKQNAHNTITNVIESGGNTV